MTETVLFVGGSMDGERLERRGIGDFNTTDFLEGVKEPVLSETYINVIPQIYLISTESPDNLIPLLIEGYRRKE